MKELDELNVLFTQAEAALCSRQLGVRAEIAIPLSHHGEAPVLLAFGKYDPAWRLLIISANGEETPLVNASMKRRIAAARLLPLLWDSMLDKYEERREEAIDAQTLVRKFISGLRGSGSADP